MIWTPTTDARKQLMAFNIKKKVFDGLYKGFLSTFGDSPTKNTCDMAMRFAKEAAPDITDGIVDSIDTYLKSLVVNIPAAPQTTLACAVGPVTGTVLIPDSMIIVS